MADLRITPCIAKIKNEMEVPLARIQGIINSDTLPVFREYVERIISKEPKRFIFDFKELKYINSSGIGEMIRLSDSFERFGGSFIITSPTVEISHLIRLLGLQNLLPVLPSPKYAMGLFKRGSFKNSTIAIINKRLVEKLGGKEQAPRSIPMEPLGNYTMMVVPTKDFFTKFLEKRLAGVEGKLKVVKDLDQARKIIKKSAPDMLIIDDSIQDNNDLVFDVKSDLATNRTRVIKMLRENTDLRERLKNKKIYIKEDETIIEPFDYNELLALARKEYLKYKKIKKIVRHSTRFEILSSEKAISEVNNMIFNFIGLSRLSDEEVSTFHMAVKEAIDNAYRHGNAKNEDKIIAIDFFKDAAKIVVTVKDEGEGFDYEYFLDAAKRLSPEQSARGRHAEDKTGGLGIIMMKKSADILKYDPPGNRVVLTKNLAKEAN